jgi:carbonic anhydrase
MDIQLISAAGHIDTLRTLFREYEAFLGVDLCFQSFGEELRTLPGKYAEPKGRCYRSASD